MSKKEKHSSHRQEDLHLLQTHVCSLGNWLVYFSGMVNNMISFHCTMCCIRNVILCSMRRWTSFLDIYLIDSFVLIIRSSIFMVSHAMPKGGIEVAFLFLFRTYQISCTYLTTPGDQLWMLLTMPYLTDYNLNFKDSVKCSLFDCKELYWLKIVRDEATKIFPLIVVLFTFLQLKCNQLWESSLKLGILEHLLTT